MKKLALFTLMLLCVAGMASAGVVGSAHDLTTGGSGTSLLQATDTTRVCVFCHTPHQVQAASSQDPLWNHTVSSAGPYTVYSSVTLNANVVAFSGGATPGLLNVSQLCMSCHDGTIGVGNLYNPPNDDATPPQLSNFGAQIPPALAAYVGTDLSDDHPVNFTYDTALANEDTELVIPASAAWVDAGSTVPLFGSTVQCASCHDPHNDTNIPFLVVDNAASALCVTCHIK